MGEKLNIFWFYVYPHLRLGLLALLFPGNCFPKMTLQILI